MSYPRPSAADVPAEAVERPDLIPAGCGVVAVYYENCQHDHGQDPDYDIWTYAVMQDGTIVYTEHKNHWNVTAQAVREALPTSDRIEAS